MVFDISNSILKISISLLIVAINSIIIHYIVEKMNLDDKSFDNPTTIALILGVLFYLITLFEFQLLLFVITLFVMPYLIKYFYEVDWEKSIKLTLYWLLSIICFGFLLSLFYILIY